jgi:hypothetical protein
MELAFEKTKPQVQSFRSQNTELTLFTFLIILVLSIYCVLRVNMIC